VVRRERFLPWAILLALMAVAFFAGFQVPYRVDSDVAFQLKSLEQWLSGASPTPATLSLPEPQDLSRSSRLWSRWWLPGFPFIYAPLAATGLPLAAALRLTSLLLFLAGCAGFLRFAARAGLPGWARLLFAVSLAGYGLTLGGATSLRTVDVLTFAAGPWLALLAWSQVEGEPRPDRLFLAGLALGATYWIRYGLFLTALPLLAWMVFRIVQPGPGPHGRRSSPGSLAALAFGFLLPVAALLALDLRADDVPETLDGGSSVQADGDAPASHLPFLALSMAGGPGLSLFQNEHWLTHLVFFSDSRLPFFRGLDDTRRLAAKVLLGVPATLLLVWALVRARRRSNPLAGFALFVTVAFFLELAVASLVLGYNYLAYEPQRAAGLLPLVQALVLGEWLAGWRGSSRLRDRAVAALGLTLFFAVPLAFVGADFVRNEIGDRLALRYTPSSTGLWMPEISQRNVPEVQAAVSSALLSPGDAVVLAGTESWRGYSAFVPWLEFPQRVFPVAPYSAPLGTRLGAAADLSGSAPFHSDRPLRLVLVLARGLVADGSLPRLQARFPQARSWAEVPVPAHSEVAVYFSDLQ